MTTQSGPVITDAEGHSVAGHDGMLLNIGWHNAYFTRNIVILTDNAGHTGVGGRRAESDLSDAGRCYSDGIRRGEVARLNKWCSRCIRQRAADFDTFGKRRMDV